MTNLAEPNGLSDWTWRKSSFSGNGGTCVELGWRKSSFSANGANCVEVAPLADQRIAVRNSNNPDAGTILFTRAEVAAWVNGCKAGEFDDLT